MRCYPIVCTLNKTKEVEINLQLSRHITGILCQSEKTRLFWVRLKTRLISVCCDATVTLLVLKSHSGADIRVFFAPLESRLILKAFPPAYFI